MAISKGTAFTDAAVQYAKNLSYWFRDYITAIKHGRLHPFTPLERKVREATRNEKWGPTGSQLNELADASFDPNSCSVIFAVLVFRMGYPSEKWRNVYKALQVLDFILKRGSEHSVVYAKEEFPDMLERLSRFNFIGADGRDYGVNVRIKAAAVQKLISEEEFLKAERQKNQNFSQKLKGFTRSEMQNQSNLIRSGSWGGDEVIGSDQSENGHFSGATRGAGEMKGVSLEENKKRLAELKDILSRPENKICADCRDNRPTWASINCGVFICLKCSGIHRGLGVRSCTLDTWLPEQVAFLSRTGNKVANEYWEANLIPEQRPISEFQLASFIQDKYARKKFASGTWPPAEQVSSIPLTAQRAALDVGRRTDNRAVTNDMLKFEDEAFAFENESDELVGPTEAEIVAQEAFGTPGHAKTLSFENSALFEQRSSFIKMRSRLSSNQAAAIPNIQPLATTASRKGTRSTASEDVIQTTLLDMDDLESVSETMSVFSGKVNGSTNANSNSGMPAPSPARHVVPRPIDLLDAPMTVPISQPTQNSSLDQLNDPFSFMTSLEPLQILKETPENSAPVDAGPSNAGPPQKDTPPVQPPVFEEEELKSIQELSRLDQLFVQQVEDFLSFGYRTNVYGRPSYL